MPPPPRRYALRRTEDAVYKDNARSAFAEFVASFLFVFAAEGSVLALGKVGDKIGLGASGLVAVALAQGLSLAAAVATCLRISGGHVNPAVTFGTLVGGRISLFQALHFFVAQLLGSVLATLLLRITTAGMRPAGLAVAGIGELNAVVLEMVMTFGLVYVFYSTWVDPRRGESAAGVPAAVGFIMAANVIVGGSFDGACMNPARAFGPALVGWRWNHHWVFWAGPLIGGALAGLLFESVMVIRPEPAQPASQPFLSENY